MHVRSTQCPQRISREIILNTLNPIYMHVIKRSPYTTRVIQGSRTPFTFFLEASAQFVPTNPNSYKPNTTWTLAVSGL
jgi:hypothetical protein